MLRHRLRLAALGLSGLALFAGVQAAQAAPGGVPHAAQAAAASGCDVLYSVQTDWGAGFVVNITITNLGAPITAWTLTYSYPGNQTVTNGWNGNWSQSGSNVTVTNASYDASLGTGGTANPGAQFAYSGTNAAPTGFALNGVQCNQPTQPMPSVSITSPSPGQMFTPGSNITVAAAAASSGSGSIKSVDFFESTSAATNTLIGTATTSPYSITWANVPAGSYSLTAVATDNLGQATTSDPVAITVSAPSVVVSPTALTVQQGGTGTTAVSLSAKPSSNVTVTIAENSGGDPDVSASPTSLTFTADNWNTPQNVTITAGTDSADVGGNGVFTASATGYGPASVTVTEAAKSSGYDQWFLSLYSDIKNPSNGYFSPKGIPYHSVETLIVEAPDYGHETTSETYSYWLWLEADYGRVTGDWTNFNNAWTNMETYAIPSDAQQPGQCAYNPSAPAQYGPEEPSPSDYPVALNSSVPVGSDPLFAELKATYGTCDMYQPVWIMDTDNRYGFGQDEDGTSTPSLINTFQRGPEESVWDTVPQPDWDTMKFGGPNGFLDLFNNGGGSFAPQYKYTDAPDADARLVQAAFWADTYAKAQGKSAAITTTLAKAAKLGDYLRYSMFDKYFKQISANCSQVGSVACPAGTSKANEDTYLLSWFDAWGGSTTGAWSWRISGTEIHEGYQNPLAAYALSADPSLVPLSPTAKADWATSLTTQLNLFQWLQSSQGAIAGGVTNNWGGNYGDVAKPPAGDPTFDGMYYDFEPQYHNPPSNQWFGYQTWPMERVAEYYYMTGNAQAKAILDKWVSWAESVATFNTSTGAICLPGTLNWSGQPSSSYTSSSTPPAANPGLSVSVSGCSADLGVSASLAKVYEYYAAKSGDAAAETAAQNILDVIHKFYADSLGFSAPETRTDYKNFTVPYSTSGQEGAFFPAGWTGTYPGGVSLSASTNTFLSLRPWYTSDPAWPKVQAYLDGGPAPVFNYHRFWAESEIATAFDAFAYLFPSVQPPAGF
ncbi:MAG TPA: glycoside hydrolase family 48 protein [Streptosporangiaceae bacterium]|nr:glycoside hydrolase family 48 protein [Streptosporangiaceae bacterium]